MDFAHSGHFTYDVPKIEQCSARKFCLLYIFNDSGGYYILFDGEIEDKSHLKAIIKMKIDDKNNQDIIEKSVSLQWNSKKPVPLLCFIA